jgi:hypothetical protein
VLKPDVPAIRRDAYHQPVRPADTLKVSTDIAVIQVGVITAIAADELIFVGVAAFMATCHDADRLASQDYRPPQGGFVIGLHALSFGAPLERIGAAAA